MKRPDPKLTSNNGDRSAYVKVDKSYYGNEVVYFHFGEAINPGTGYEVTSDIETTGNKQWVQTGTDTGKVIGFDGQTKTFNGSGLDFAYPAPPSVCTEDELHDEPAQILNPGIKTYETQRSYTTWYMFNPDKNNAENIFVPLSTVSWTLSGKVQYDQTSETWNLISGSAIIGSPVGTTEYPSWQSKILDSDWKIKE